MRGATEELRLDHRPVCHHSGPREQVQLRVLRVLSRRDRCMPSEDRLTCRTVDSEHRDSASRGVLTVCAGGVRTGVLTVVWRGVRTRCSNGVPTLEYKPCANSLETSDDTINHSWSLDTAVDAQSHTRAVPVRVQVYRLQLYTVVSTGLPTSAPVGVQGSDS